MTTIKLIASDLDGTLLQHGAQSLKSNTCDLIRALNKKGIRFMAASGRQYDNLRMLFEPVKDDITYLCQNGASACANGTILFQEKMEKEMADQLVDDIMTHKGSEVMVSDWRSCYVLDKHERFYRHMHDVVRMHTETVNDLHDCTGSCTKISIYEESGVTDFEYWKQRYGKTFSVALSGEQWIDVMGQGVHKGKAMGRMLETLNVSADELLVLGDNLNDLEMIALAGLSATVPGGVEEVKQACDVLVDSVEDMMEAILNGKDTVEAWKEKR